MKWLALLAFAVLPCARAQDVAIAAASDLAFCIPQLDESFVHAHPDAHLTVSTGSSGNFSTQIQNGAPFDVFLSADEKYPQALAQAGQADGASLSRYAVGQLALWTSRDDVDVSKGLSVLESDAVHHVAIANPEHAPYGRAARAALQAAGLWERVQPKLVLGENIAQTLQFAQNGNAEVGLVALSLLHSPQMAGSGHQALLPDGSYPPIVQAAIVTAHGKSNALARAFVAFLTTDAARDILQKAGYRTAVP